MLRSKTRSRKGRDLKRMDGVKQRLTRRGRKQRGGAGVTSATEWLTAVSKLSYYASPPAPTEQNYKVNDAVQDVPTLPPYETANSYSFEVGGYDIRQHAANVREALVEILKLSPTIGGFSAEMKAQATQSTDVQADEIAAKQLAYLSTLEAALRAGVSSNDATATASGENILSDVKQYPLYIWALATAAPIQDDDTAGRQDVPVLTPIPVLQVG